MMTLGTDIHNQALRSLEPEIDIDEHDEVPGAVAQTVQLHTGFLANSSVYAEGNNYPPIFVFVVFKKDPSDKID